MEIKELISDKVRHLPGYIFSEFNKKKMILQEQGMDVIDLGIGAPDLPTPQFIIDVLTKEAQKPAHHRYSPYHGIKEFRIAVSEFYAKRYNVDLDPRRSVNVNRFKRRDFSLYPSDFNPGDGVLLPILDIPSIA